MSIIHRSVLGRKGPSGVVKGHDSIVDAPSEHVCRDELTKSVILPTVRAERSSADHPLRWNRTHPGSGPSGGSVALAADAVVIAIEFVAIGQKHRESTLGDVVAVDVRPTDR